MEFCMNCVCLTVATLDGKTVLKEGWVTLFKGKKTGLFSTKLAVSVCCTI